MAEIERRPFIAGKTKARSGDLKLAKTVGEVCGSKSRSGDLKMGKTAGKDCGSKSRLATAKTEIERRPFMAEKTKARSGDLKMEKTAGKACGSKSRLATASERYVCLRMVNCYTGFTEWYTLDVLNNKKLQNISPFAHGKFGDGAMFAYMGSTVYCLGGVIQNRPLKYSHDVYMVDQRRRLVEGAQKLPPMIKGRAMGEALALNGKLFVFGGCVALGKDNDPDPWGEYYDFEEKEGKWKPMRQPPTCNSMGICVGAYGKDNIFVGFTTGRVEDVFIYHIKSDTWEFYQGRPCLRPCNYEHVMVDDTLYWFQGKLYAYDLKSQESYSGRVKGLEDIGDSLPLIHLRGNEFCTFEVEFHYHGDPDAAFTGNDPSTIHCTRFRVVKAPNGYLDASVLARHSTQYFLANQWLRICDGITLDFGGVKKQGKENKSCVLSEKENKVNIEKQGKGGASGERAKSCVFSKLNKLSIWDEMKEVPS